MNEYCSDTEKTVTGEKMGLAVMERSGNTEVQGNDFGREEADEEQKNRPGVLMTAEFKVRITDEDIDDIMCSALEGGITYWCSEAEVEGEYLGEYGSEQISRGGILLLHDIEEPEVYELTKEKLLKGIMMYLANPTCGDVLEMIDHELRLDTGYVDCDVSDCMVQYALFGDIVFG